jgi:hypothetical protein
MVEIWWETTRSGRNLLLLAKSTNQERQYPISAISRLTMEKRLLDSCVV